MQIEIYTSEIKSLIATDSLHEAANKVKDLLAENDEANEIVEKYLDNNLLVENIRKGTFNWEQSDIDTEMIRDLLLEILEYVETEVTPEPKVMDKKNLILIAILIISMVTFIVLAYRIIKGDEEETDDRDTSIILYPSDTRTSYIDYSSASKDLETLPVSKL